MSKIQLLFCNYEGEAIGHTEAFSENMAWLVPADAHLIRVRFVETSGRFVYPDDMLVVSNPPGSGFGIGKEWNDDPAS